VEASILWDWCELIVKLILDISSFYLFQQPVQYVFNYTQEQLMKFIRLPKLIERAEGNCQNWLRIGWIERLCRTSLLASSRTLSKLADLISYRVIDKLNAPLMHHHEFHTSGMSCMRLEWSWLVLENPRPRLPKEHNIVSGIHQHNSISSWDQLCQDFWVGTALSQQRNAMLRLYYWHRSGDIESAQCESRRTLQVYSRHLFEYYELWDWAAKHANPLKYWSSESSRIHKWLAHFLLRQATNVVFAISSRWSSSPSIFSDFPSVQNAPVQHRGVQQM
jgi:hypothetical protein